MTWDKDRVLESLEECLKEGEVDEDVKPLLDLINSFDAFVTTSSCAGRIMILQVPALGDKRGATVLGKWHRKVAAGELADALEKASGPGLLFLFVQSPIVHVRCRDIASGAWLRALGEDCGLKHSTVRTLALGKDGSVGSVVVELLGTGSVDMPLGTGEKVFPDEEYLAYLAEVSNMVFDRNRTRFERFLETLGDPDVQPP